MSIDKGTGNFGEVLAIIPARGGSKGIKQKNIRDVCGKPLIYYQINNAIDSELVSRVVLATDDDAIAETGKNLFGNKIEVIMRPPRISHDLSKTEDTLIYVLEQLNDNNFDVVVTLEPTNPLNRPEYVDNCIRMVLNDGYDSACCVVEDYGFFLDTPTELEQLLKRPMRQDIKPKIRETGNCWATNVDVLLKKKNRLGGKVGYIKIPLCDSYHLDDENDWRIIESLFTSRILAKNEKYFRTRPSTSIENDYEKKYWGKVTDPDGVVRDRTQERDKRIKECKQEIDYINNLEPSKILDIGCGLGFLLSGINDKWKKYGLEVSSFAAERANKYGKIFCGNLREADYEPDYFDVVVLYHVIEHMNEPAKELQEVKRILKPYGKLIVATPDFECGLAGIFGSKFRLLHDKTHISLFGTMGLYRMLTDLHFEVEKISYPYFDTEHFTKENLLRLFDADKISPPFYGNVVTLYAYKK